jgi:preprotein translocase subunit SecA
MIRNNFPDVIYKTRREKFDAAMDEIVELHEKGQPVLVGTISIDVSESFSKKLKKRGIKHSVLNAKNHEKEAEIITMAGHNGGSERGGYDFNKHGRPRNRHCIG